MRIIAEACESSSAARSAAAPDTVESQLTPIQKWMARTTEISFRKVGNGFRVRGNVRRLRFLLQQCNTIEVKVPACLGKGEARPSQIQHRRCKLIRRGRAPCCCWLRLLPANPVRQTYTRKMLLFFGMFLKTSPPESSLR